MDTMLSLAVIGALLVSACSGLVEDFSYSRQDEWPGVCVTGNQGRQSPINITTGDVQFDDSLGDLELGGWGVGYEGDFTNMGTNVQFNPTLPDQASIRNHLGIYELKQFHIHWGRRSGEGSEHLINSSPSEIEIHFVHMKQGVDNITLKDALSVVAVLADVDNSEEISGPWAQLDASRILAFNDSISVSEFRYDLFLPNNLDYYYYEGSLTTPSCYESVAWFVLRNRITVPGAYLDQLRMVEGNDGEVLGFNFRMPQSLEGRVVRTNSLATRVKPMFNSVVACLVILSLLLWGQL